MSMTILDRPRAITGERPRADRRRAAERLAELFRLCPPEMTFESAGFDREHAAWSVRGSAQSTRQILDFIQTLEATGRWSRVELKYSSRRVSAAADRTEFELALQQPAAS